MFLWKSRIEVDRLHPAYYQCQIIPFKCLTRHYKYHLGRVALTSSCHSQARGHNSWGNNNGNTNKCQLLTFTNRFTDYESEGNGLSLNIYEKAVFIFIYLLGGSTVWIRNSKTINISRKLLIGALPSALHVVGLIIFCDEHKCLFYNWVLLQCSVSMYLQYNLSILCIISVIRFP